MSDNLRLEVKLLKATQDISYKELAEYLEIKQGSIYCWLNGCYDLSISKKKKLEQILTILKE